MIYRALYSKTFQKQIQKKDKDKSLSGEVMKKVGKLQKTPYLGKLLKYRLFSYRSVFAGTIRYSVTQRFLSLKNN